MDLNGKFLFVFFKKGEKLNSCGRKEYSFRNYAKRAVALGNNIWCGLVGE